MARKQVQLQRFTIFGQWVTIKRVTLDLSSRARFEARSRRSTSVADRDVREPGRRGLPRGLQPRDRLSAGLGSWTPRPGSIERAIAFIEYLQERARSPTTTARVTARMSAPRSPIVRFSN